MKRISVGFLLLLVLFSTGCCCCNPCGGYGGAAMSDGCGRCGGGRLRLRRGCGGAEWNLPPAPGPCCGATETGLPGPQTAGFPMGDEYSQLQAPVGMTPAMAGGQPMGGVPAGWNQTAMSAEMQPANYGIPNNSGAITPVNAQMFLPAGGEMNPNLVPGGVMPAGAMNYAPPRADCPTCH